MRKFARIGRPWQLGYTLDAEEGKKRQDSSRKERMERVDGWGEDEEGMGGGRGMKKGL